MTNGHCEKPIPPRGMRECTASRTVIASPRPVRAKQSPVRSMEIASAEVHRLAMTTSDKFLSRSALCDEAISFW